SFWSSSAFSRSSGSRSLRSTSISPSRFAVERLSATPAASACGLAVDDMALEVLRSETLAEVRSGERSGMCFGEHGAGGGHHELARQPREVFPGEVEKGYG